MFAIVSSAHAVPVSVQIEPVGVYQDFNGAFGLAYDPVNDLIWASQGDVGDNSVHSFKPFKNFTASELAGLPTNSEGISQISNAVGELDVAGTTAPGGAGGFGSGSHFSALAFDAETGQLAQTASGDVRAYDPFTAANQTTLAGIGSGFADGLDLDGSNAWFSPDIGSIFNNGALFASNGDSTDTTIPDWTGLGSTVGLGWSGVEQVADLIFAVAVHSPVDAGRSRTIVAFDRLTGMLDFADPDGDPIAARWEDMAFDGRFLYAADLRGNEDGLGPNGDIYVFDVQRDGSSILVPPDGGEGNGGPASVPEPASLALFGIGLAGLYFAGWRRKAATIA